MRAAEDEETPRGAAPSPGGDGDDAEAEDAEEEDGADGRCGAWRRGWARYEALATAVGKAMLDADEEEPPERGGEPRDGVVVRELEELHNQDMIYVVRAPRRRVLSFISRGVRETLTKRVDGDGAPRDRAYYAAAKRLLGNETIREILINGVLTVGSCFFTYAIIRSTEATVSPTVAQLLVTVVFSSFYPEYAATFGIGAFSAASGANIVNYAWLTLQAFTAATVWIALIYSEILKVRRRLGTSRAHAPRGPAPPDERNQLTAARAHAGSSRAWRDAGAAARSWPPTSPRSSSARRARCPGPCTSTARPAAPT